ncbi:MAG: tryptophan--tRNA ligase, partial [Sphingomonas fennica]
LARDIATKFNTDYDTDLFVLPEPIIPPAAARIMSLRDGAAKMSKSDPSDMSRINLTDDADAIAQKVKKAKTDPEPLPSEPAGLEGRAEARNLVGIAAALTDSTPAQVLADRGGQGFGPFKTWLAEVTVAALAPIGRRIAELSENGGELDRLLGEGAAEAREAAAPTLAGAYRALGL